MSDASPEKALDFALLANFVHQVINPLNGVSGTLDNIIDGTIGADRAPQRIRAARAQLEHCALLVRNLAFFSEISSLSNPALHQGIKLKKTCVIPQLIIEAAMFFQELGALKSMTIDLQDRETQYRLDGNPDLLRQVFMNLFDNAVKYGKRGSAVVVEPWVQKSTRQFLVRVAGDSLHIPHNEWKSVFQLGVRSPTAREKIASGTGLGLYICEMILRVAHGATIEVESSSPDGKTAFLIRFPSVTIGAARGKR